MVAGPSGPDPDVGAGEVGCAVVGAADVALGVGDAECEDAGRPVEWGGLVDTGAW